MLPGSQRIGSYGQRQRSRLVGEAGPTWEWQRQRGKVILARAHVEEGAQWSGLIGCHGVAENRGAPCGAEEAAHEFG
jgi:hypothetical protein